MTDTPPWGGQDQPTAGQPGSGEQPDTASPGQPGYGQQPGYSPTGQPAEPVTQPRYPQPTYGQPGVTQPAPPGYGQPSYGQPGSAPGQPGYGQPGYGQPDSAPGQPGYGQPGYGQPDSAPGQPAFGQAGYGLPGYAQYAQPGYGQYGQPGGWNPVGVPSPGGIPLRPLGLGDILSGAFNLIRQNPATTLGLTAIVLTVAVVVGVIFGVIASAISHPGLFFFVVFPVLLLLGVMTGGLTAAMGRGVLGRKISIADAVRISRPLWVILAILLLMVIFAAISIPLFLILHGWAVIPVLVLETWLGIMVILTIPVVVLERQGPISAIGRSWRLIRGSYWRVFGTFLLAYLMLFVVSLVITVPLELIAGLTGAGFGSNTAGVSAAIIVFFVGEIVIYTLTTTIMTGVIVLIYADMRMRKEGMDLVLQQAAQNQQLTGDEFASVQGVIQGPASFPGGGYPGGSPGGGYVGGTPGGGYPSGGTPGGGYPSGGTPGYPSGGTPGYPSGGTPGGYPSGGTPGGGYPSGGTPGGGYPSGGSPGGYSGGSAGGTNPGAGAPS